VLLFGSMSPRREALGAMLRAAGLVRGLGSPGLGSVACLLATGRTDDRERPAQLHPLAQRAQVRRFTDLQEQEASIRAARVILNVHYYTDAALEVHR
jgi:hypothetical protein